MRFHGVLIAALIAPAILRASPAPNPASYAPAAPAASSSVASFARAEPSPPTDSAAPPTDAAVRATVEVGRPWKFGARAGPRRESSLGPLRSQPPPIEGHPLPRVIVDVVRTKASKGLTDVEAAARRGAWSKTIECYRPGAQRDPALAGETLLRATIRRGVLTSTRVVRPMRDESVSRCLADAYRGMKMPARKRPIDVTLRVRIFPGDEPLAPKRSELDAGPGTLDLEAVATSMASHEPALSACYARALEWAPALTGTLAVRLRVDPSGAVGEAFEEGGPFPEERVTRCVLAQLRGANLPDPHGGHARVVVPLHFAPPPAPSSDGDAAAGAKRMGAE